MFDTILVPTDGSPEMARVIDRASELALLNDATIHFLYVVTPASFVSLPMEASWEGVETMLKEQGEAALREAEDRCRIDRIEADLVEGPPSREIVTYADETPCDLIVMGTHGRGGLNRLLLGSVAERVIRSATVPVMTIRVGEDEPSESTAAERQPITADQSVSGALE